MTEITTGFDLKVMRPDGPFPSGAMGNA